MAHQLLRPAPTRDSVTDGEQARIELRGVSKRYRVGDVTVSAVEGVDVSVAASSFVVLLGPSGSGKTTLLNLIGAHDVPTDGTVLIDGADISHSSSAARFDVRRRSVSFICQSARGPRRRLGAGAERAPRAPHGLPATLRVVE